MIYAAGILFLTSENLALFLRRGNGSDHPHEWCCPGGQTEQDETADVTAVRETLEESGFDASGFTLREHTRTQLPSKNPAEPQELVDFTTFLVRIEAPFTPVLCNEHDGWVWSNVEAPPEPLHPGVRIALDRLKMDELGVARAIADGRLVSPQQYENVTLFAMRVTGTGASYRSALKEYVWRDPDVYMNEEFLARCNGLPVIVDHPQKGATLDAEEFQKRIAGTVFLPYLKSELREAWAIVKIFDPAVSQMIMEKRLSTSPSVVFRDPDSNSKVKLENGQALLIEGKPSLLDHLAICEQGVWDKGGESTGITISDSNGGKSVAEDNKEEPREDGEVNVATGDADAGEKLDKLLSAMDSLSGRMDSIEANMKRGDATRASDSEKEEEEEEREDEEEDESEEDEPTPVVADKGRKRKDKLTAKKDGPTSPVPKQQRTPEQEEAISKFMAKKRGDAEPEDEDKREDEEEEEERSDSQVDALGDINRQLRDIRRLLPRQLSDADHLAMVSAQERADRVFSAFRDSAPRPLQGEDLLTYRRRLAGKLKAHSTAWKDTNLNGINDEAAFKVIEDSIYNDAMTAAMTPATVSAGELREVIHSDATGRRISEFAGRPSAWMQDFSGQRLRIESINKDFH